MKRQIATRLIAALMLLAFLIGFMPIADAQAASVKLSEEKKTVYSGDAFELTLKNAKGTVKWKTSNKLIATVENGKVNALRSGKVTISATYKNNTYKCKVTVKAIHLNCKSVNLYVEGTMQLKMFGSKVQKYSSDDTKVATVSDKGLITAVGRGSTTVKVSCSNGRTYKCAVTVEGYDDDGVAVAELDYLVKDGNYYTNGNGNNINVNYGKDNLGRLHDDTLSMYGAGSYVTYKLDGAYASLSGVLYMVYDFRSEAGGTLIIEGDGKVLWKGTISKGKDPMYFDISVKDVDKIKVITNDSFFNCAIGEFRLYP